MDLNNKWSEEFERLYFSPNSAERQEGFNLLIRHCNFRFTIVKKFRNKNVKFYRCTL